MKDKINEFFTHKFLPILLIFILFLFNMCVSSFASFTVTKDDVTYIVPSFPTDCTYSDYVLCTRNLNGEDYFYLFLLDNPKIYTNLGTASGSDFYVFINYPEYQNGNIVFDHVAFTRCGTFYRCLQNGDSFSFYDVSRSTVSPYLASIPINDILVSTIDIINNYDGSVVFQPAPAPIYKVPAVTEVVELPEIIQGVLKMIIPIGLVIFGIGLVIYLIRLLIWRVQ